MEVLKSTKKKSTKKKKTGDYLPHHDIKSDLCFKGNGKPLKILNENIIVRYEL